MKFLADASVAVRLAGWLASQSHDESAGNARAGAHGGPAARMG